MRTMRIGTWVIVIFILAAMLGMTTVIAQGQAPVAQDGAQTANVVRYSYWETEPNNSRGQARVIQLGDVVGGSFNPNNDVDYFKFHVPNWGTKILIDGDKVTPLVDHNITLYREDGTVLNSDNSSGFPALLYQVLDKGWYYLKVENDNYNDWCTDTCSYQVMVTSPLLISAAAPNLGRATVDGIRFGAQDVLAFSFLTNDYQGHAQHKWNMFLNATAAGFTTQIVNISTGYANPYDEMPTSSLAVTFGSSQSVDGWGGGDQVASPWDWVILEVFSVGDNTWYYSDQSQILPGGYHGLTTLAERPDALVYQDLDPLAGTSHDVWFSTTGNGAVPKAGGGNLKVADEDLFRSDFGGSLPWTSTMEFDGSRFTGLAAEDIVAADLNTDDRDALYLTILGTGTILGHRVTQKDIFAFQYGATDWGWDRIVWHGPDYGWYYNIDAFDWPDDR